MKQPHHGPVKPASTLAPLRLWRLELDVEAGIEAELRRTLSSEELARAEAFADRKARRRYAVARGTLRELLGSLLGERPGSVPIEEGPRGKPRLAGAGQELHFSVSRSGDVALVCIAGGRAVGVDLEALRPVPSAVAIARRRFAPAEARFVEEGGPAETDRRFLRCWTRKEAVAKAIGTGLDIDLRGFIVPLGRSGGVVSAGDSAHPAAGWLVADVAVGDGHVAALAMPAPARPG